MSRQNLQDLFLRQPPSKFPELRGDSHSPTTSLRAAKMDMEFSAPVHMDGALLIEIIDSDWAADVLPMDDVEVPASAVAPLDDDDIVGAPLVDDESAPENMWTDLGLDALAATAE